jgi:anthranilate/para-aminobenzoate synthase component I
MLFERATSLAPDPIELARRLYDQPDLVLARADEGRRVWIGAGALEAVSALDPEPLLGFRSDAELAGIPRWFGLLPYESRRALERRGSDTRAPASLAAPLWRRYGAWVEVGERVRVVGDDEARVAALAALLERPAVSSSAALRSEGELEPAAHHAERVERALELIARGEVYEVNLARRLTFRVAGPPFELLARLTRGKLPPYALALAWPELGVVSTSPELFLAQATDGLVWTSPIKGTRPRTGDPREDAELARELEKDPKEVAELTMIVDVERNDLGRLALPGSVRLVEAPRVRAHGSVFHRVATVEARLPVEVSRAELLTAMLPSGSVTGAPKVRAMEVIAELEAHRRGLYTGAFGFLKHDGTLELGMAIRTLTIREGLGEYFSGGGIVADSDPAREVEETLWKAADYLGLADS